jgi:acyl dehydratase
LRGHGNADISSDGESDETMMPAKFRRIRKEDGQPEAVVHGMLVASLFSSIFGTLIPGCIYKNQRLEFRQPVFVGDTIIAKVEVTDVRNMKGRGSLVTCDTNIISNVSDSVHSTAFVDGEAKVWLPGKVNDSYYL